MLELQTKIKRQIEIIGLVSDTKTTYRTTDLADIFSCEELTIKRDLQDLRSATIDIHSERRKGICITTPIDQRIVTELVLQYVGICYSQNAIDKTTSLMVRKKKLRALHDIVHIQRCIEQHRLAVIDYEKEKTEVEKDREIGPLLIFQSEGLYRLLALNNGKIKQYHLNKILSLRVTNRKFKPVSPQELEELFRYSWKSWLGNERHTVKLQFTKKWMEYNLHNLMDTDSVVENDDGSAVITVTVNSLTEIASWIAGRGHGVTVLEPEELKTKVIALAQGVLASQTANHKD
ncbi:MAG: WYL domain-containing protein [Ignavibacteriales bacterium]|nr:WYL domain-containing protein [Ignavibacteriales bacterium]